MKKHIKSILSGMAAGGINGLLGTGGGLIAVPVLGSLGLDPKNRHATSLAVIYPISLTSAVIYLLNGQVSFSVVLPFLLPGMAGAFVGAFLLKKIGSRILQKIFAALLLFTGIRMFLS